MDGNFTTDVLEKTIAGLARRMGATALNIANMNTPKYSRQEVSFEDQLKEVIDGPPRLALKTSRKGHISNVVTDIQEVAPKDRPVNYEPYRFDLNNVDPETEMARMAQTRMMYAFVAKRLGGKLSGLKKALGNQGGGL